MIDARRLLSDLQRVVRDLESDLRARVAGEPDVRRAWETEFEAARASERTGLAFEVWRDQRVTQVAVGWVLACVFTRFCEDNGLLEDVWLSGRGSGSRRRATGSCTTAGSTSAPPTSTTWRPRSTGSPRCR